MDQKRDSRSQRFKNLQYKSRGRGRHHGGRQEAPANDTVVEGFGAETDEQPTPIAASSNRLGSNWDRYSDPGEADTLEAGLTESGSVRKQSEGLDYSSLLEEADALLSGGAAALLKNFTLEDFEDPFSGAELEEQPLPLGIDLHALNEALSRLSLPERLGLEFELFSGEDQEPSTAEASVVTTSEGASKRSEQPTVPSESDSRHRETGSSDNPAVSNPSERIKAPRNGLGPGPPLTSKAPESKRPEIESRKEAFVGQRGPTSSVPQPAVSTSGQEADDNADLLTLLLGESNRPSERGQKGVGGPDRASEMGAGLDARAREQHPGNNKTGSKPGADTSRNGTVPRRQDSRGHNRLGRTASELGSSEGRADARVSVGRPGVGSTEESGLGERRAADPPVTSAAEDDIDGLLAVLTPSGSGSTTEACLPACRPASSPGPAKEMLGISAGRNVGGPVGSASGPPRQQPQVGAVGRVNEVSRTAEPASKQSRPHKMATPAAPLKASSQDEDFDAWLESIS